MSTSSDYKYVDFDQFPENWLGRWVKFGHASGDRSTDEIILKCAFCRKYEAERSYKTKDLQTYRVKGVTETGKMWDWKSGVCRNPSRCWGEKNRYWTILKNKPSEFVFQHHVVDDDDEPGRMSLVDEIR